MRKNSHKTKLQKKRTTRKSNRDKALVRRRLMSKEAAEVRKQARIVSRGT